MITVSRRDAIVTVLLGLSTFVLGRKIMSNNISDTRMPVLFIGHGSPMNAIETNDFTKSLKKISTKFSKPKAILVISAHWETSGSFLTGMDKPKTIHDFYGFPKELFDINYPASGAPKMVEEISSIIKEPQLNIDFSNWGLDHGTWSVLKHLYPMADIAVFQLSIDKTKPLEFHFELGKKLKYLREQGVLIIGSGNIVHNLSLLSWTKENKAHDWAIEFDEWSKQKLLERDFVSLINKPLDFEIGRLSIPTLEHYIPLLYILGASDNKDQISFEFEGIQHASISMRTFMFL